MVVLDLNGDVLMGGLVDDNSVDSVVEGLVVVELKGSFVVDIAGDVDSRSVNDLSHEPFSVAVGT